LTLQDQEWKHHSHVSSVSLDVIYKS